MRSAYVFMAKETMEKLLQNVSFITGILYPKFYLNQTNITIKKEKNLI